MPIGIVEISICVFLIGLFRLSSDHKSWDLEYINQLLVLYMV